MLLFPACSYSAATSTLSSFVCLRDPPLLLALRCALPLFPSPPSSYPPTSPPPPPPTPPACASLARSQALESFAERGLRTLVLLTRELSEEEWAAWDARYQEAAAGADEDGRHKGIEALCAEVECGLRLLGGVGIEDNLQEGVFETISLLRAAGINVWMITGDKKVRARAAAVCSLL